MNGNGYAFRQQALVQYQLATSHLQQTRESQGTQPMANTYVPLAKGHLDTARVLILLDRNQEARSEIHSAEQLLQDLLLHPEAGQPLDPAWLWRVYYLLGDINLYAQNKDIALHYYQLANTLNPGFVPGLAMVQYLGGSVAEPPSPVKPDEAGTNFRSGSSVAQTGKYQTSDAAVTIAPEITPRTTESSGVQLPRGLPVTTPPAATRATGPQADTSNATSANNTKLITPQQQESTSALYQDMKKISSSKALPLAAQTLTMVASLLEVTELAPLAAAITLAGMIVDYAVEK